MHIAVVCPDQEMGQKFDAALRMLGCHPERFTSSQDFLKSRQERVEYAAITMSVIETFDIREIRDLREMGIPIIAHLEQLALTATSIDYGIYDITGNLEDPRELSKCLLRAKFYKNLIAVHRGTLGGLQELSRLYKRLWRLSISGAVLAVLMLVARSYS